MVACLKMTDPKIVTLAGNIQLSTSASGKNIQSGCLCLALYMLSIATVEPKLKFSHLLLTLMSFQTCTTSRSFTGNTSEQVSV